MASRVDRAVAESVYLAGPGNLGYTQGAERWSVWANGQGDCATFFIVCMTNAGIDCGGATFTGDLKPCLRKAGWKEIPISQRHKGCALLRPKNEAPRYGHVALCVDSVNVSEALSNEYGTSLGGKPGDQTGNEVLVRRYNGFADGYYCFEPPAYAYEDLDKIVPVPKREPGGYPTMKTLAGDVYRLTNPKSGDHMYTTNPFEKDDLVGKGWKHEGELGRTPMGLALIYRLINADTGEHLWTAEYEEVLKLCGGTNNMSDGSKHGWQAEGEPFIAYQGDRGAVKLHRVFKPGGFHHLTSDPNEVKDLVAKGWTDEGVKFSLDKK